MRRGSMLTGRDFKLAGKGFETREGFKAIKKIEKVIPQSLRDHSVFNTKGILKGLAARMGKHELEL